MPFALVIIGLIMIVTGARNTHVAFAKQVQSDFTGQNNFLTWVVALGAVGSLGYVDKLRQLSHYFMALIIIGMLLSNRGFFAQFSKALATGPVAPAAGADATPAASEPITSANVDSKIAAATSGAFGQSPGVAGAVGTAGKAKFNGWTNYLLGGGWLK